MEYPRRQKWENKYPHEHLQKRKPHNFEQPRKDRARLIHSLLKDGIYTRSEIAKQLGISKQALSQMLAKYPDHKIDYSRAFWASELDD